MISRRAAWPALVLAILVGAMGYAQAAQWRATSPKEKSAAAKAATSETLLELLTQLEALQAEVRQLRNQTEVQQNEIRQLKSRVQDLTRDLDRRVRTLERQGGSAAVGKSATRRQADAKKKPARATTSSDEQQAYEAAFQLLKQGDYSAASRSFRTFVSRYPSSPLASNAQYWIAESNYFVRNFRLALTEFLKVESAYPESRKLPDALLKIGYTYYELGEWKKARRYLEEVTRRYPNTRNARSASTRLAVMKKEGH